MFITLRLLFPVWHLLEFHPAAILQKNPESLKFTPHTRKIEQKERDFSRQQGGKLRLSTRLTQLAAVSAHYQVCKLFGTIVVVSA
jgi:hypothetical protein